MMAAKRKTVSHGLSERQVEVLLACYRSSDGYIERGSSRIWSIAPQAVQACMRKGLIEMPRGYGRARLTPDGRFRIEELMKQTPPTSD
jgi:hypothetical protein